MRLRFLIITAVACAFVQSACAWEPKSPKECRLAFLMGMTGFTTGDPPIVSVFPQTNDRNYQVFEDVARLYAADIGVPAEDIRSDKWREQVSRVLAGHLSRSNAGSQISLEAVFGDAAFRDSDVAAAYLAGAYSAHGTPTGFRLVQQRKGLFLVWLVRFVFPSLTVDATLKPGIPGNITITLHDGGQQMVSAFAEELETVRIAISRRK